MKVLVDTNVLLRAIQHANPHCVPARGALKHLRRQDDELCLTPQNIREFWNACTRPVDNNGLGIGVDATERHIRIIEHYFTILPDSILTYANWRQLVFKYQVIGTRVHDAYLAASMKTHGVGVLLTFNVGDFARYQDIEVINPHAM